ncbi:hypothetical protein SETIT_3G097100v2 [Setaria italica]|uniref:Uncharacterized protein n=1 Tax=Setaria italica TaxID=4555 RepID=A0A368QD63_SETIT|nr:hypothetical protein SETIT_3G097100v2 [Setaria italica]
MHGAIEIVVGLADATGHAIGLREQLCGGNAAALRRAEARTRVGASGVDGISFTVHPLGTCRPFDRICAAQIRQSHSLTWSFSPFRSPESDGGARPRTALLEDAGGAAFFDGRRETRRRGPSATPVDSRRPERRHASADLASLCFLTAASTRPRAVSSFISYQALLQASTF